MKKLKYNRMNMRDIMSFNESLKKCYIRENVDHCRHPNIKAIINTKETTQQAYSDTQKSENDVDNKNQ